MQHELEKFLAIVEHGSFTAAARMTYVSQPALTTAIKSLENKFGTTLLVRGTRPLQLTNAGKAVYNSASRIRLELNNLEDKLADISKGETSSIAVGAIDSIAMRLFQSKLTAEKLTIHVDNSARLIEAVRLDRLDLAFITEPVVAPGGDIVMEPLTREQFVLVTHPKHVKQVQEDLSQRHEITRFITYNLESTTYQRILVASQAQHIHLHNHFVSTSPELMRQLVRRQEGVALLPKSLVEEDLERGDLHSIDGFRFDRSIALIYRTGKYFSSLHQRLIQSVKQA